MLNSLSGMVKATLGFALLRERLATRERRGIGRILIGEVMINAR